MRHLWDVFQDLFDRASKEKLGPICNIYSAQAYGDIWRFQELVWQPGNDPKARFDSKVSISLCPLMLVELTAISISKQILKMFRAWRSQFYRNFKRCLPQKSGLLLQIPPSFLEQGIYF